MDSIVWPCHTAEWLHHIYTNYEENFLNLSNIFNLYWNNKLNFMDSIVWPCHKAEWLHHIYTNYEENFLNLSNIFNLYWNNKLNFMNLIVWLVIHLNGFIIFIQIMKRIS